MAQQAPVAALQQVDVEEDASQMASNPGQDGAGIDQGETVVSSSGLIGALTLPVAGTDAHIKGVFGAAHAWPIIPIATMLLPNGKVMGYGTDSYGNQGAANYAVWDPARGLGNDAFETFPNSTGTDIFCSGQALLFPGKGLMLGGDVFVGEKNNSNDAVTMYDPVNKILSTETGALSMQYKRWYPTAVTLPNKDTLIVGGRSSKATGTALPTYAPIPEVRDIDTGVWRSLTNASSDDAYGRNGGAWNYPRAWVNKVGKVFILTYTGYMFELNPNGAGTITPYVDGGGAPITTVESVPTLSSVMYRDGQVLSIRNNPTSIEPDRGTEAVVVDITGAGNPVITRPSIGAPNAFMKRTRHYGGLTVLADGSVWANGGSAIPQKQDKITLVVNYEEVYKKAVKVSELWDPATKTWKLMASAQKPRLYHSSSILLPDGSVLTGGGGAPGWVKQQNGEIYYPPYLYNSDDSVATRPVIKTAPLTAGWGATITFKTNENITRVTLVRSNTATHAFNNETRFFDFPAPTSTLNAGEYTVKVTSPANGNVAPPGYYMLFAWNANGVPSIAKIIRIGA